MQQQTEFYLGRRMEKDEWDKTIGMAERKLRNIISREGDGEGKRNETWYLAQLAAEIARSTQISKFTQDIAEFIDFIDDRIQEGKRKSPCDKHTSNPTNCPYCITAQNKLQ